MEFLPLFGILLCVSRIFLIYSLQQVCELDPVIPHLIDGKTEEKEIKQFAQDSQ